MLINSVKADHHDLKNHLTAISGLLALESYEIVNDYVKDLIGAADVNSQVLSIRNPVLASLFISKMDEYKRNNIVLQLNIKTEKIADIMSSTDLIRLLSNLLDNAYDATMEMPIDKRFVSVELSEKDANVILIVKNSSVLKEFNHSFFEVGYSTKRNGGENRGYGMSIIQNITNKYHAKLDVDVEDDEIYFKVLF